VSAVSGSGMMGSEWSTFKHWTEMKAQESCWGEENMKQYMVHMKKAVAKCNQVDAPELNLPPFKSTYRFINTLLTSADEMENNKIMFLMKMMQMNNHNNYENSNYRQGIAEYLSRNKRAAKDSAVTTPYTLDIGDRLTEKVKAQQHQMETKVGNMTCVLRECGILNQQNELDARAQKQYMNQFKVGKWLKERINKDIDTCFELAENIPREYNESYNYPGFANVAQIKSYMKCIKHSKMRSCMFKDVKEKLEANFGPVKEILEQTQLSEDQLYPLVMNLLHGEEMEFNF